MTIEYDEDVFANIPSKWKRELGELVQNPSRTSLWQYSVDRERSSNLSFEEFRGHLNRIGVIDIAFKIPPVKSAPRSNRIFAPGFYMPKRRDVRKYLIEKGDLAIGPMNGVGRLHSIWQTFYGSSKDNFLDDPLITLPRVIIHGETMKGHDGVGTSHFDIADLMQRLEQKYSIPVYSLERNMSAA